MKLLNLPRQLPTIFHLQVVRDSRLLPERKLMFFGEIALFALDMALRITVEYQDRRIRGGGIVGRAAWVAVEDDIQRAWSVNPDKRDLAKHAIVKPLR